METYGRCIEMPIEYTISTEYEAAGNPADCQEWDFNITITLDTSQCIFLADKITVVDWILLGYSLITWIIVIGIMKLTKLCLADEYPACKVEIYEKILECKAFGMLHYLH